MAQDREVVIENAHFIQDADSLIGDSEVIRTHHIYAFINLIQSNPYIRTATFINDFLNNPHKVDISHELMRRQSDIEKMPSIQRREYVNQDTMAHYTERFKTFYSKILKKEGTIIIGGLMDDICIACPINIRHCDRKSLRPSLDDEGVTQIMNLRDTKHPTIQRIFNNAVFLRREHKYDDVESTDIVKMPLKNFRMLTLALCLESRDGGIHTRQQSRDRQIELRSGIILDTEVLDYLERIFIET
jgi:hypothetical protein